MSVCWVKAGWCGHEVVIDADKKDAKTVALSLETSCPYIQEMHHHFKEINILEELSCRMGETRTYKMASQHLPCPGCPTPSAILKTVEVLSGSCNEQDAVIKFLHFGGRPSSQDGVTKSLLRQG